MNETITLGAGVTGLTVGLSSRLPVYEAGEVPGGICSSYYIRPMESKRLYTLPSNDEVYRFEIGGGHWIFGADSAVLHFISRLTPTKSYTRRSSVYFPDKDLLVPYPIQNHLSYLGKEVATQVINEIWSASRSDNSLTTMAEWIRAVFGKTLCRLFFEPFHDLYTARLWQQIAPQDTYKSPIDLSCVIRGMFSQAHPVGYNATFVYPVEGLSSLARRMAQRTRIHFGKQVITIDVTRKEVYFSDGSSLGYKWLISSLPLNRMMEMTGLHVDAKPDPYTSILVINIGAIKGPNCPKDHWLYIPNSKAGFHRVGFYSNVDVAFLHGSVRKNGNRVSIYVEKAYKGGEKWMDNNELKFLCEAVVKELQEWGFIDVAEVVDPTWIDVGYTWRWPNSVWRQCALDILEKHGIYQVGRYGRWVFQGIADSIRDGFVAGSGFMNLSEGKI